MSNKHPDDNDRAKRGEVWGYGDDAEDVDVEAPEPTPPPVSGTVPRLLSAAEGSAAIRAALRSPAALVVLRSTPGCGKSKEAWALVHDRCRGDERAIVTAPTHRLGEQIQAALGALGVPSTRPLGVARVRLPIIDGNGADAPACVHHQAAELLAIAGARVREELCQDCPAREDYPETGGECPAYAAGAEEAPVAVMQHALLAAILRRQTELLTAPPAPSKGGKKPPKPARLLVVDEPPSPFLHSPLDGAGRQYDRAGLAAELGTDARERLEPALFAVLRAVEAGGHEGASLRALLVLAGGTPEAVEADLAELRALDGADLWQKSLPGRLARSALHPSGREHALDRLAVVARFSGLLAALVDAAHAPDRPVLRVDEDGSAHLVTLARWTRYLGPYLAAGGRVRLLDATAPVDAFRALWGDALEVASVEVEDAPGVTRRFLPWAHAAKRRHTSGDGPNEDRVRGPLRRLAELGAECSARKIGLLTHKPLADALRAWLAAPPGLPAPAFVPDELAALVGAGVEVNVGHYGAQRGLNTWADCDAFFTVGDAWPNLGAARAEAAALGLDPDAWAIEQARAELVQGWGRIRAVHRPAPVVVAHFGSVALAPEPSWAPQWAGVRPEPAQKGRPRSVTMPLSDPSTWAEERKRLGLSWRQHAAALGLSLGTYQRKAPRGSVEGASSGGSEDPPRNQQKEAYHKWPLEVSGGVSGAPGAPLSSIAIFDTPGSAGFGHSAQSEATSEPPPPSTVPAGVPEAPAAPAALAPSLAAPSWGRVPGVVAAWRGAPGAALAPGRGSGEVWCA